MKRLAVIIVSISIITSLVLADETCMNVTYKNVPNYQYEKRYCCRFLEDRHITLEARSKSGWIRYANRNNFSEEEKAEFAKCLKVYFNSIVEFRMGNSL